MEVTSRR